MHKTLSVFALLLLTVDTSCAYASDAESVFTEQTAPPTLQPYIVEGMFELGDWEWMRGKFAGATDEQKENYAAIAEWREECSQSEKRKVRTELAILGYNNVPLTGLPITTAFCDKFAVEPNDRSFQTFADFQTQLKTTQPIFDAFVASIDLAEIIAHPVRKTFSDKIRYRVTAEQLARSAFAWTSITEPGPRIPRLTEEQKPIFLALLSAEIGRQDRRNTEWLKQQVAENGWPTISEFGEDTSSNAWLLAQHADHDPVWQIRVLQMMEPLLDQGEVSKSNYAYLYDRVMLKINGTQRYATQVTCQNGQRVPRPLEDTEAMPGWRAEIGLDPFEEYLTWFSVPCPPT